MAGTIPYSRQSVDKKDIQAVVDVLSSPYLTTGPKVREFEEATARYVGAKEAVSFSSGTAALHAAMSVSDVGPGDEVLVPTLSFLASSNAILYCGGKPVFVDSEKDGFNVCLKDLEAKITSRTKAMVVVHFAGEPLNMEKILGIARKNKIRVIEDAAHAFGASIKGKKIGGFSELTVFSFHPVKHITTGEGGMVTTNNPVLAKRLQRFRHHGIDVDVIQRDEQQRWDYDMVDLGFNYRLTDIQSALGLSQLKKAELFLKKRRAIAEQYNQAFSGHPQIQTPPVASRGNIHSYHLYVARLQKNPGQLSRDEVFRLLRRKGIGVQVHYRPIHLHSYYKRLGWKRGDCPNSEAVFETMLSLPIFPEMTTDMVRRTIKVVGDVFKVPVGRIKAGV